MRVKQLEWSKGDLTWKAETPFGPYWIDPSDIGYAFSDPEGMWSDSFNTIEMAKAAAQADFTRRSLECWDMGEPVAWLHPKANWSDVDRHRVLVHCRNDGPFPIPLYTIEGEDA